MALCPAARRGEVPAALNNAVTNAVDGLIHGLQNLEDVLDGSLVVRKLDLELLLLAAHLLVADEGTLDADALADAGISVVRRWLACEVSMPYARAEASCAVKSERVRSISKYLLIGVKDRFCAPVSRRWRCWSTAHRPRCC